MPAVSLILLGGIRESFTEEGAMEFSLEGLSRSLTSEKEHFRQRDGYEILGLMRCDQYLGGWSPEYPRWAEQYPLPKRSASDSP